MKNINHLPSSVSAFQENSTNHPDVRPIFNSVEAEDQRLQLEDLERPRRVENMGGAQAELNTRVQSYQREAEKRYHDKIQSGAEGWSLKTVKDRIIDEAIKQNPALLRNEIETLSRGELAQRLTRFDWRDLGVVPPVRDQGTSQSCWGHVATEVFESSLMIQRLNFSTVLHNRFGVRGEVDVIDSIVLNVNSTINRVAPRSAAASGRYETAFNHYFMHGIPASEIKLNGTTLDQEKFTLLRDQAAVNLKALEERDRPLEEGHASDPPQDPVKIVAWDYVLHDTPWEIPHPDRIKTALLEHGPLGIAIFRDDKKFVTYPNVRHEGNGKLVWENSDTGVRFEKDDTGNIFARFPAKMLQNNPDSLMADGTEEKRPALQLPDQAPPLFKIGSYQRQAAVDQEVEITYFDEFILLKFPAQNEVEIESSSGNSANLLFPNNTEAKFVRADGILNIHFLWHPPSPPIYKGSPKIPFNHYLYLIGWEDSICAWIIQNSAGEKWGINCKPGGWAPGGGYMYAAYNTVGQFAAWVEAELTETRLRIEQKI